MKIEKEQVSLDSLNLDQLRFSGFIQGNIRTGQGQGQGKDNVYLLGPRDLEIIELFSKKYSIQEVAQFYLKNGILISFDSLKKLVSFLVQEKIILNPNFQNYFSDTSNTEEPQTSLLDDFLNKLTGTKEPKIDPKHEVSHIPFFRSLSPAILDLFLNNMNAIETPANITICKSGQLQRSLFVLLRGQASVFSMDSSGKTKKVAVLSEGSVFGEIGFFFGTPRTADVVTDQKSLVLRFRYLPETFDQLIKKDKVQIIQKRFWLVHALLKSSIFKALPDDCFDALISAGSLKSLPAMSQIIREGENGQSFYVVVQGSLSVTQNGIEIRKLEQGDCFGEIALLMSQGKRTATVFAENEVLLLEIDSRQFYQLMSENLFLAAEFEKVCLSRIRADQARTKF